MSGNFAIKGGGRTPNGKCHLKFPFWLSAPFPNRQSLDIPVVLVPLNLWDHHPYHPPIMGWMHKAVAFYWPRFDNWVALSVHHWLTDFPLLIVLLVLEILEGCFTKGAVIVVLMWSRLWWSWWWCALWSCWSWWSWSWWSCWSLWSSLWWPYQSWQTIVVRSLFAESRALNISWWV